MDWAFLAYAFPWLLLAGMTVLAVREQQQRVRTDLENTWLRGANDELRRTIATLEEERQDHDARYHPRTGHRLVRRG